MGCLRQDLRNGTLNLSDLLLSSVTNQELFKRKLTHSMNDFQVIHRLFALDLPLRYCTCSSRGSHSCRAQVTTVIRLDSRSAPILGLE